MRDQLENRILDLTTLRTPITLRGCETKTLAEERLLAMAVPEFPLFKRTRIDPSAGAFGTAPDPVPPVSEIYRLEV